ncbi:MAG: sulfatase-like hydrolase/transferase [Rikenellaceae bacterium]
MNKYYVLLSTGVVLTTACSPKEAQELSKQPNVVVILTDDQGWGDFGFNGNPYINTPTLDSLSEISAHLTQFYSSPLSATTRAGLLTGCYHLRSGALCVTRAAENMDEDAVTIAEAMRDNGYATGCFGKWHNGAHYPQDPVGQGFDEYVGFSAGHLTNYFDSELLHNQTPFRAKGYITDVLTDYALDFIKKNKENPFFCYIPYNAPHAPYQVPDKYYDKYKHLSKGEEDTTPAVYAMCESVDDNIARVLNYLDSEGLSENTIVVFFSDNGPNKPRYNGDMRGIKSQTYEGGVRVPCLVYWKGKINAFELDENLSYIDIMPTILALCGIEDAPKMDGVDFSKQLLGDKTKLAPRTIYTHKSNSDSDLNPFSSLAIKDDYRLLYLSRDNFELYDLDSDPSQTSDISEMNAKVFASMRSEMQEWYDEVSVEYEKSKKRMTRIGAVDIESIIPAHEAIIGGKVHYFTNEHGWAGDWVTNIYKGDTVAWDVEVVEAGEYDFAVEYALSSGDIEVSVLGAPSVKLAVFEGELLPSPDRVQRVEAYERTWGSADLGAIKLSKGQHTINLDFVKDGLQGDLQVKSIRIKKK